MKKYFEVVKNILVEVDETDNNWAWYPVKYNDDSIEFRWGYLDYLEDDENFIITTENVDDEQAVKITIPSGSSAYVLVGNNSWDDCETIEEGIRKAILSVAKYVKMIY